ncbi:MAG: efflux RND transporter permease subunit [Candidatus Riflebacteria bacterium]|nr:efflux RND transporter permease subunit [Candidatus Riflebacteria bacterium]
MNIAEVCVKRPVFTVMMNLCLVVLGIFSYQQLGLDLFPKVDYPVVRIEASMPGAPPEEMEMEVARLIEEAVNTIGGIDTITSRCSFGSANVMVRFQLEKNIDVGAQEVRDKVGQIIKNLPTELLPPTITKIDPDAAPIITYIISSKMPIKDLSFFVKKRIVEPLETIDGVGATQLVGARNREIQIVLDSKRLSSFGISASQVKDALKNQNIEVPGGNITNGDKEFVLRNMGKVTDPKLFADLIVTPLKSAPVRIAELGTVIDGEEEPRSLARLDGKTCLALIIQKQTGNNTLEVIERVNQRLDELKKVFPKDFQIVPIRDQSAFIKASIHEVNFHLIMGAIMASLVVYLFMANIISTMIAAFSIPVSIVSTFLFMRMMGYTLNNMTMLGLTLAIGIVIDDAIVVLENIFRHMEELKSDAVTAAIEATAEIYLAVMATSLSLAVIFVPVAFMSGIIGNLLNNYGLTIAFSILVSIFVSFTLTPMLCSILFQFKFAFGSGESKESWFYKIIDRFYGSILRFSLRRRWVIILAAVLCLVALKPMYDQTRTDFLPPDDTSEYSISFRTDEGCSIDGTTKILNEVEAKIAKLPGIKHIYSSIGEGGDTTVNSASIFLQLVPLEERKFTLFDSIAEARKIMKEYQAFRPSVSPEGPQIMGGGKQDIRCNIQGPDLDQINVYVDKLVELLRKNPMFGSVNSTFIDRKPEIHVVVDHNKAFKVGLSMDSVFQALRTLIGGVDQITRFQDKDELFEVRIRLRQQDRADLENISRISFPTPTGDMVRLDQIASVTKRFGPAQINRTDRQRSISFNVNLAKDRGLGEGNLAVRQAIAEVGMTPDYTYSFDNKAKEMDRTKEGFIKAFLMSAIFMYMILASQFESFLHPLTIMLSLPLSIPFALISLLLWKSTLNVYSALGLFMLFGIVKKNAILQIDYTNTLRERGMERDKAVLEANHARLRPILMTTVTLVAGMLPLAMGKGPGAATRASMAIVIIGGQTLCLLITLLITPVAYTLFDDFVVWVKKKIPAPQRRENHDSK